MTDDFAEQVARARSLSRGQIERLRQTRSLNLDALAQIPDQALQRVIRRVAYPDLARVRHRFRARQARDERGRVPPLGLVNAIRHADAARSRSTGPARVAGVPVGPRSDPKALLPVAGLPDDHSGWTALGPGNIGGRTRSIVIHPLQTNVLWAASVGGGVWQSSDSGSNWQPVDDLMANLAVTALALDPSNPQVIYAGTGEGYFNLDAIRGAGIFRTVDGTTWSQLAATATPSFQSLNRLAVSANGAIVLAATDAGMFRSDDTDRLNWTQVLPNAMADVRFAPGDNATLVAGGLRDGSAYYSSDAGLTWSQASASTPWHGRVELCFAVKDPSVVYASVDMGSGMVWRSSDAGQTFTPRTSVGPDHRPAAYLGDQGWYGNAIWAGDPTNVDLVIVGGINLWKSLDGGDSLVDISTWWDPRSAHADHHIIVSDPSFDGVDNKRVYFGNDGGIYKTDDVSAVGADPRPPRVTGWTRLDNAYSVTQFYAGAGNASSGVIVGGAQDNGTLRFTEAGGFDNWQSVFGGDGGWCAADSTNPDVFYGEYVYLNIHRSLDGGNSADYISGQYWDGTRWTWKPLPYSIPDAQSNTALFIAPFVLDPNEANRILAGGLSMWRTNDARTPNTTSAGPAWTSIKDSTGSLISAIAIAAGNSDIVWVGHTDGQVYASSNATADSPIWRKMDHAGSQPLAVNRYCTRIAIHPNDSNTVYVLFGGYAANNVWRTTDAGATWTSIGAGLPQAPARSLTVHPAHAGFLYLGTEVGLFASEDGGANWAATNEGPTSCSVDDMFWMASSLVSVTHGRGMFRIDLSNA